MRFQTGLAYHHDPSPTNIWEKYTVKTPTDITTERVERYQANSQNFSTKGITLATATDEECMEAARRILSNEDTAQFLKPGVSVEELASSMLIGRDGLVHPHLPACSS